MDILNPYDRDPKPIPSTNNPYWTLMYMYVSEIYVQDEVYSIVMANILYYNKKAA
jgi:hypothetical protein